MAMWCLEVHDATEELPRTFYVESFSTSSCRCFKLMEAFSDTNLTKSKAYKVAVGVVEHEHVEDHLLSIVIRCCVTKAFISASHNQPRIGELMLGESNSYHQVVVYLPISKINEPTASGTVSTADAIAAIHSLWDLRCHMTPRHRKRSALQSRGGGGDAEEGAKRCIQQIGEA
ncbi:Aste57867_17685 [Aphanomyces stellatus]|uniref:Aste57867_17685 protein n=1 Tax=Aphanomyces stellatus TaxID=120398 RepID=A0A485LBX7_9STRA|nr:hypothetical protein As57867_017624 [Aphanomyces stellatus]VFT94435.1 Aste57867_17685 [Aphanomyces stellatus]